MLGQIKFYDSPGLSDPNFPIKKWIELFNQIILQPNRKIDLVICVIEYTSRPSNKEQALFSLLNQAFTEIKPNNMTVILNKCPK